MFDFGSLNPEQRLAVKTINGPVLILAGAGTGKTRTLTCRVANMVRTGIAPDNILGVTFTNKAAREMQERVSGMLPKRKSENGNKKARPTICTFHSLCVRILRKHIDKLGYKKNFVIYSQSEQIGIMKRLLSRISAKGEKTDPYGILSLISRMKNGSDRSQLFGDDSAAAMADHLHEKYDAALRACNAVDFDDLIVLTLRLFTEHPDALEACRHQYKYVMVDEYQDTNASQFQLVHSLTKEHRNLCVVGDDDQSIYGWRGAEIANLLNLEDHFPEVKVIKLEQNYRSTNTILDAANALITKNVRRRPKRLWSENGTGEQILLSSFKTDEDEAKTIVEEIETSRLARNIPWREHAILFRMNQQSRPVETALRQAGVRYHLVGGQSFFDRREIKDFVSYLKMLVNPHDDNSLLRIANVPARGLSANTMERLLALSHERQCSVFAVMRHSDIPELFNKRIAGSIDEFLSLVEETHAELQEPDTSLIAWAKGFFADIDYFNEIRRQEKDETNAENRIRNIQDLLATLDDGNDPGAEAIPPMERVQTFLEDITLDGEREEDKETSGDAVTLITMHSCKGLEFPHVFVVGAEDGLIPHSRSKLEGTLDEERRLFYVAITRAQKTLTISHCESRKRWGETFTCHPSPFLKDIPENLVEHLSEKSNKPVKGESGKNLFAALRAAAS